MKKNLIVAACSTFFLTVLPSEIQHTKTITVKQTVNNNCIILLHTESLGNSNYLLTEVIKYRESQAYVIKGNLTLRNGTMLTIRARPAIVELLQKKIDTVESRTKG
jgi:hypothetical protein